VLASLVAAETSAGTFFGTAGEGFRHRDYTYLQLAFGTIIGRVLVSYIFIKPYYDYKVYSIYEYLTARFRCADEERCLSRFHDYAPARVRRTIVCRSDRARAGLRNDQRHSTRPKLKHVDLYRGDNCHRHSDGHYTTFGGIKAVIWTDLIQASIMIGSALIALGLLVLRNSRRLA